MVTRLLPIRTLATITGVQKAGAPCLGSKDRGEAVSSAYPSIYDFHKLLAIYGFMLAAGVRQRGLNADGSLISRLWIYGACLRFRVRMHNDFELPGYGQSDRKGRIAFKVCFGDCRRKE